MKPPECNHESPYPGRDPWVAIARLEERNIATENALHLQATEYSRRLEELNHAHQDAVRERQRFVTIEQIETKQAAADAAHNGFRDRLTSMEASQRQTWRLVALALALIPIGLAAIGLITRI